MIRISSQLTTLRLVHEDDINFIYDLRSNKGKYLNNNSFTQENNRIYIQTYRKYIEKCISERESPQSYYFSIEINSDLVGTVRLYNIDYINKHFTWGSWILSKGGGARAVTSALLVYAFAFDYLHLDMAFLDVRKENKKVISFHKKIGAIYEREDEYNVYFTYTRTEYLMMRKRYNRYIDTIHVCYMI